MKTLLLTLAATATLLLPAPSQAQEEPSIKASTVMHGDGSRTDTQTNYETRTSEEKKYDPQGRLTNRIVYDLDEENRPTKGTVFNDKDVQVYNFTYTRDALGRIIEEKDFSPDGQLLQRFAFLFTTDGKVAGVRTYDAEGKLVAETKRKGGTVSPGDTNTGGGRRMQRR